jgi:UDP:flavonoid glycosyltransferase YjiC (YdhE family)
LIIPTFSERESNARRIASVKAGDYILPKSDSRGVDKQVNPDLVREKAMRILSDPVYLKNARDIQQKFESYGGAILAAELITEVI